MLSETKADRVSLWSFGNAPCADLKSYKQQWVLSVQLNLAMPFSSPPQLSKGKAWSVNTLYGLEQEEPLDVAVEAEDKRDLRPMRPVLGP